MDLFEVKMDFFKVQDKFAVVLRCPNVQGHWGWTSSGGRNHTSEQPLIDELSDMFLKLEVNSRHFSPTVPC